MPSPNPELIYEFPEDFLLGVSSPLIPAGGHTDWAYWAKLGRAQLPTSPEGLVPTNFASYLSPLGIQLYRHTAAWSQIEPEPGKFDLQVLAQLATQLSELKNAGTQIMLTLHSYAHPEWFHQDTPWHTTQSIATFTRYVTKMFETLSGVVDYWVTFNDPNIFWLGGYVDAIIPPGVADNTLAPIVLRNLLEAHSGAYHVIKAAYSPHPGLRQVGMSLHQTFFSPARAWNVLDHWAARKAHAFYNELFLEALSCGKIDLPLPNYPQKMDLSFARGTLDFIGINYYTRTRVQHTPTQKFHRAFSTRSTSLSTDTGWESYPKGLLQVLRGLSAYPLPLFITENGCADGQDRWRAQFIFDHLSQIRQALKENIPVKGYCYHAWVDGIESLEGDQPKYGLYGWHPQSHTYTLRESGHYYGGIARSHKMFIKGVV